MRRPWGAALVAAGLAGAALLLAFLFHQDIAAIAAGILVTVPALYLAWKALPAVARKPSSGRLVRDWDPVELGVHRVVGGGPMPTYIRRRHDELLAAVLDPAVRASRLVVLRGGSSTGKSRAAYQAAKERLPDWRLDYPQDPGALAGRLEAGIGRRTVLWLGELRDYADLDGGLQALARLADLLDSEGEGPLVITTVWPEHWQKYTAAAQAKAGAADPSGVAGRLLERLPCLTAANPAGIDRSRGGIIDVPSEFTSDDLDAAMRSGDAVLAEAASASAAAGQGGQVTQYLAGVPALLERYADPGGDPYGQAVITAAMDAARLGHASPLPATLLQEAAVGYLTGPQRTHDIATWRGSALDWATAELRGAVRALEPIPPLSGTGVAGYRVADYLDQHGRRTRQDQLGKPSLWDALATYTTNLADLDRLGQAARNRGLYRHAAALWTKAATLSHAMAALHLIGLLRLVGSDDITDAARWAAAQASLEDPWDVTWLLRELRDAGAGDAAAALATRAATDVSLDSPGSVALLLRELRETGAHNAARALLARDPVTHASLNLRGGVSALLRELREARAPDAAAALATRAATQTSLDNPERVARLLRELREARAPDAAAALATRAATQTSLEDPGGVARLLEELREAGAHNAARALLVRDPAAHASLKDPGGVARLLEELREAGAPDAVAALLVRDPAAHASLNDPYSIAWLLHELQEAGARDAAAALTTRAAAHASLDDPGGVARLLRELREAEAHDAVQTLATWAATQTSLDDPGGVARLLEELREAGAGDAVAALATWAAAHASLDDSAGVARLLEELREAGAPDAVAALLARDPAAHASLDDPGGVAMLLHELQEAGAGDRAGALATWAAAHASLKDPEGAAMLLEELREAGASDAVAALLVRDPAAQASLDYGRGVARLLQELREAGAHDAAQVLATRAANAGGFRLFLMVSRDQGIRYRFGREPDGTPSQSWARK